MHPSVPRPKRIAILQSNYIPWKGYFDLMNSVDEFVLLDSVQYTRSDWRNRNRITTPQGVRWVTIPIQKAGRSKQRIREVRTVNEHWASLHWKQVQYAYRHAPAFRESADFIGALYASSPKRWLTEINQHFLTSINHHLGITTPIRRDEEFELPESPDRTSRLIQICKQAGAAEYVSGPAARGYLDEDAFREQGINVTWFEYPPYPEYPQGAASFEHAVSVLDVLLHMGTDAPRYILRTIDR